MVRCQMRQIVLVGMESIVKCDPHLALWFELLQPIL